VVVVKEGRKLPFEGAELRVVRDKEGEALYGCDEMSESCVSDCHAIVC